VLILAGSVDELYKATGEKLYLPLIYFKKINLKLSDHIIVYSSSLIDKWNLKEYAPKIQICYEHILDTNEFHPTKMLSERPYQVGFVGRLSEEKGIKAFLEAIPLILKSDKTIKFLIIGDGPLKNHTDSYISSHDLVGNVVCLGWIEHDHLSTYFNDISVGLLFWLHL